ncbi:MFS transporter [Catenulispora pinistramenti]|uniref:MFS transporter n=1 Tax=Catenulispora pinistramenti TaxID=2705254 RepID=UPI002E78D2A1|nr:MFS transporter [Catenulispora pinistramenti]
MAKDQTPNRDGEERTRVFDAPEGTRPLIPQPPPLPPKRPRRAGDPGTDPGLADTLPAGGSSASSVPGSSTPRGNHRDPVPTRTMPTQDPDGTPTAIHGPDDLPTTIDLAATLPGLAGVAPELSAADIEMLTPVRPESEAARILRRVGEGTEATGRAMGKVGGFLGHRIRKYTEAGGARESGLSRLIELHAVNTAGDLLITLALAQSVFFGVQPGQARGKVALYLVITMVPFVLLAPVIGPLLDRFGHGRRIAMALTMAARLVLALIMARTVNGDANLALYPAAFGCLAASKAYGVTRSAVIPRLVPHGSTLIKANSRTSMASIIATFAFAPIGGLLVKLGAAYCLIGAALVFALGAYLAIRLPSHVDSAEGEQKAQLLKRDRNMDPRLEETMPNLRLRSVGPAVMLALRANAAFRCFSGFLTIFMAFLVRYHPLAGYKDLVAIGMIAGAAAVGNAVGTSLGSMLKARAPEGVISAMLALTTGAVLACAFYYSLITVLTVAAVAAMSAALAKLSLDALLQRDTLERVRTSAFARSETLMQLAWVVGGGLGIAMSYPGNGNGTVAFIVAAVALLAVCVVTLKALSDLRFVAPNPAQGLGV